ncbi:hypothetical protein BCR36DRAFT_349382 [Piromyces finnis]|uniref:Uncharacterized protein n=1 Tax=Piromyces finnis TaxID=1754191 RepID=A0A1Y1VDL3_9FUNG|nr:hypothetical protein BCR36DRAFT_349382 [Piromyces finnis]|eukprot:ORX53422.1 hypothetical protein BCR36DRAFT_349382 [Piromyces finnis]
MNRVSNNNTNNEMKKTINELISYELSQVQQNLKNLKEYNQKYDEQLFLSQSNNMYFQQNPTYINNNKEQSTSNSHSNKNIPNVPSIGKILPLSNVNSINQNGNSKQIKKSYKLASYTKYVPFTSFGPIYDLSDSALSTFEISTLEPYLFNLTEEQNNSNNDSKNMEIHKEINEHDRNIEISETEMKELETLGIDLENICHNFNLNFKKNNTNSENSKTINEKISEMSNLLKQLYEYQENRKDRNYYQTEISEEEKELASKIESKLNTLIKNIPPSQLISKSDIQYAMNNIQHYEPWYNGVLTYDNGSSTTSQSSIRYGRNSR